MGQVDRELNRRIIDETVDNKVIGKILVKVMLKPDGSKYLYFARYIRDEQAKAWIPKSVFTFSTFEIVEVSLLSLDWLEDQIDPKQLQQANKPVQIFNCGRVPKPTTPPAKVHTPSNHKTKHKCVVTICTKILDEQYLMCIDHWKLVPPDIQQRIYRGHRAKTSDWRKAVIEARDYVNREVGQ